MITHISVNLDMWIHMWRTINLYALWMIVSIKFICSINLAHRLLLQTKQQTHQLPFARIRICHKLSFRPVMDARNWVWAVFLCSDCREAKSSAFCSREIVAFKAFKVCRSRHSWYSLDDGLTIARGESWTFIPCNKTQIMNCPTQQHTDILSFKRLLDSRSHLCWANLPSG